jgi:hypothetical protein
MAKRRNPKLKETIASVEIAPPLPDGAMPAEAAPVVAPEARAPIDGASVTEVVAETPAPGGLSDAVPQSDEPEATTAAGALSAIEPAATETPVAVEHRTSDAAVIGHSLHAGETTTQVAAADLTSMETTPAAVIGEAVTGAEPAEPLTEPVVSAEPAQPADVATAAGSGAAAPEPALQAAADLRLANVIAAVAPNHRNREFLGRAATVALAAGLGAIVGSITTSVVFPGKAAPSDVAQNDIPRATAESVDKLAAEVATLKAAMTANAIATPAAPAGAVAGNVDALGRDVAVLKASFGESQTGAAARLLELVQQVNRTERSEADLAARLARLEKPGVGKADVSSEITGSVRAAAPASPAPPVAENWVLWRVYNGRALVQGRRGYFDVVPGANLPDLGVVREITQKDGRWVVITENGVIVAAPGHPLG